MKLHPQAEGMETQLEAGWSAVVLILRHHCHPVIISSLVKIAAVH